MAKRENYNELYLFIQVVREEASRQPRNGSGWHNPGSVDRFASWKSGWAFGFWCVPRANCR